MLCTCFDTYISATRWQLIEFAVILSNIKVDCKVKAKRYCFL